MLSPTLMVHDSIVFINKQQGLTLHFSSSINYLCAHKGFSLLLHHKLLALADLVPTKTMITQGIPTKRRSGQRPIAEYAAPKGGLCQADRPFCNLNFNPCEISEQNGTRQSNDFCPQFSDVECITIYLWGISRRRFGQKPIYGYNKSHRFQGDFGKGGTQAVRRPLLQRFFIPDTLSIRIDIYCGRPLRLPVGGWRQYLFGGM